ncbi:hypothetical protein LCGC14_0595130 [marine sediment metagenome]|uniref:PDGLE domain-containing protein n=1 Tax=marine sediment metagenome TaxID=412755 RepID=A0A0F9RH74_9ZZZZ
MRKIFALVLMIAVAAFASGWALALVAVPVDAVATGISVEATIPVSGELEISAIGESGSMAIANRQTNWRDVINRAFGFDKPLGASIFWTGALFALVWILRSHLRARNKTDGDSEDQMAGHPS